MASQYQIGSIRLLKDEAEKAIVNYEDILDRFEIDDESKTMVKFQIGYTYYYDMKEPGKAKEVFTEIEKDSPGNAVAKYVGGQFKNRIFKERRTLH